MGSVLCFDANNVRYHATHRHVGAGQDQPFHAAGAEHRRFCGTSGSAAKHHQLNCDWLGERSRAGIRDAGAMSPEMRSRRRGREEIRIELEMRGLHNEPVGVDVVEPPILFALQKEGLTIVDGQQLLSNARADQTQDEILLLTHSAAMVDAAYRSVNDETRHARGQGRRTRRQRLYDLGSSMWKGERDLG